MRAPRLAPPARGSLFPPVLPVKSEFRERQCGSIAVALLIVGGVLLLLVVLAASSYLRLGADTRALRDSVLACLPDRPKQKLALNVGWCTTAAARLGAHCFNLPNEPRAAIASLRGAEIGVYKLSDAGTVDPARLLAAADAAMTRRGWERVVGVSRRGELVGIYFPRKRVAPDKVKCCLMVLREGQFVVAQARANLEPLLEVAMKQLEKNTGIKRTTASPANASLAEAAP